MACLGLDRDRHERTRIVGAQGPTPRHLTNPSPLLVVSLEAWRAQMAADTREDPEPPPAA